MSSSLDYNAIQCIFPYRIVQCSAECHTVEIAIQWAVKWRMRPRNHLHALTADCDGGLRFTMQYAVCSMQCVVCSVQYAECSVQFVMCSIKCVVCSV